MAKEVTTIRHNPKLMLNQNRKPEFSALFALLVGALVFCSGLTGCGSTKINNQTSVGQQLQDLEKSYKDGVINQKEYERLKKAIINKND